MTTRLIDEIRRKRPERARKVLYGNSLTSAVAENCEDCQGGSALAVVNCPIYRCSFWKYRPGAKKGPARPEGAVISLGELDRIIAERTASRPPMSANFGFPRRKFTVDDAFAYLKEHQKRAISEAKAGEEAATAVLSAYRGVKASPEDEQARAKFALAVKAWSEVASEDTEEVDVEEVDDE